MASLPQEPAPERGERILVAAARAAARRGPRGGLPRWAWATALAASLVAVGAVSYRIVGMRPGGIGREDPRALMGESPYARDPAATAQPDARKAEAEEAPEVAAAPEKDAPRVAAAPEKAAPARRGTEVRPPPPARPARERAAAPPAPSRPEQDAPAVRSAPSPEPPPERHAGAPPPAAAAAPHPPPASAPRAPEERPMAAAPNRRAFSAEASPPQASAEATRDGAFAPPPPPLRDSLAEPDARAAAPAAVLRYEDLRRTGRLHGEIRTFPGCDGESWRKVERGPDGRVVSYAREGLAGGRRIRIDVVYGPDGAPARVTVRDAATMAPLDGTAPWIPRAADADGPPRCAP